MEKIKHREMPSEDPSKVVFVYDDFETELTGENLGKWIDALDRAMEIAWNHGYKSMMEGVEWEKRDLGEGRDQNEV